MSTAHLTEFIEKAKRVSAHICEINDMKAAINYTVRLCQEKKPTAILTKDSPYEKKVICAPDLDSKTYTMLTTACEEQDIICIKDGMRQHLGGIDIGLTHALAGIAETGSLVVDSCSEELRLTTMIAEYHVCILPRSQVKGSFENVHPLLKERFDNNQDYTAFITGPSRTADIERVLAIGVHGPLELHILLLED